MKAEAWGINRAYVVAKRADGTEREGVGYLWRGGRKREGQTVGMGFVLGMRGGDEEGEESGR